MALCVADKESSYNPLAENPVTGAAGVYQFIPCDLDVAFERRGVGWSLGVRRSGQRRRGGLDGYELRLEQLEQYGRGVWRLSSYTVVEVESDARVAPAPPDGAHHVRSPTIPSTATPTAAW